MWSKLKDKSLTFIRRYTATKIAVTLMAPVLTFPFVVDFYDSYNISQTLKYGNINKIEMNEYFDRKQLESDVTNMIQARSGCYFLIVGEHGVGKTSLIKKLVASSDGGMIYLTCPPNPIQFGRSFADAIGYSAIYEPSLLRNYFPSLSIIPSSKHVKLPMPEFEASQDKFLSEVKKYTKSTGRIPILITRTTFVKVMPARHFC